MKLMIEWRAVAKNGFMYATLLFFAAMYHY